jgi:hypothetical protein
MGCHAMLAVPSGATQLARSLGFREKEVRSPVIEIVQVPLGTNRRTPSIILVALAFLEANPRSRCNRSLNITPSPHAFPDTHLDSPGITLKASGDEYLLSPVCNRQMARGSRSARHK